MEAIADPYLNPYRVAISDLVVRPELRLRPSKPVHGRVAVFTAGATDVDFDAVLVSPTLGDRAALREELARTEADVYVAELKAAAIDVVAEAAAARGAEFVPAENEVVCPELDEALPRLLQQEVAV